MHATHSPTRWLNVIETQLENKYWLHLNKQNYYFRPPCAMRTALLKCWPFTYVNKTYTTIEKLCRIFLLWTLLRIVYGLVELKFFLEFLSQFRKIRTIHWFFSSAKFKEEMNVFLNEMPLSKASRSLMYVSKLVKIFYVLWAFLINSARL